MHRPESHASPGDDRLAHRYHESNFGRSARDTVWYAGQVAVLGLAYHDHPRAVYLVLAVFALFVAVATAVEAAKWRKELTRDEATGRTARARAAERTAEPRPRRDPR